MSLKIQPEAIAGPEVGGEAQGRVGGDGALAVNDLVDPPCRNADVKGQPVLADPQRRQKLLGQDLSRMNRRQTSSSRHCHTPHGSQ